MSKVQWKGGTLLSPVPAAMVSCGDMENSNIITIAWTGIINSDPPKLYISVRPSRHSYNIIKEKGCFVVNLTNGALVRAADTCGVLTGAKVDKFKKCKLTKEKAFEIDCPVIAESPLSLECKVTDIISLGSHDMFIADIVAADVDESLIDEKGKLHLEKAGLTAYSHGEYFALGKKVGSFGFSVRKKKAKSKK
ncbi:MAG: flavin reductase family protein [Ruminococcaceae bacterium]|nr:flavin reductase family protein [Oscillospiraceae bacterium]